MLSIQYAANLTLHRYKADFVHKISIALKDSNETDYWLELLHQSEVIDANGFESIKPNAVELIKLLVSIIKTTKNKMRNQ